MKPLLYAAILLLSLLASGCLALGVGGTLDGRDLAFTDVTYFELRGTDVATSSPYHRIEVWMMPFEEPCTTYPAMLAELSELRSELEVGLAPETYCAEWEAIFSEYTGLEGFWLGSFRLQALPRGDNETEDTSYEFFDQEGEGFPEGPSWDGELAWYPPTTFEACAVEFEAEDSYAPSLYSGSGGTAEVSSYSEDSSLTLRVDPQFEPGGGEGLSGRSNPDFCSDADDWVTDFSPEPL